MNTRIWVSVTLFIAVLLGGCGKDTAERPAAAEAEVGVTTEFEWLAQGTPAGTSTVVRTGDGKVSVESFVHWNNREYTVNSEMQFNADGIPVAQKITGISPFRAPIDETFTYKDGVATWSTAGENGSVQTDEPGFYVATESGALGWTEFVRAAMKNMDGEIAVLPSGTARVERLTDVDVDSPDGPVTLSLYAISGLGFTPDYGWLNEDLELTVLDYAGGMGMFPKGWSPEILKKLSAIQLEQDAAMVERLAGELAYVQDGAVIFDAVDVVDVENGALLEDHYVMVEGGRITAISEAVIDVPGAKHIDGTGKSLMPGMWDMHGHFSLSDGVLNIAGGITSVRDIGSVHEQILELTAKHDSGEVIGPNTYRSGFIDQASPYATGDTVESLEEALERVDFYAEHGYMQIKLYSSIDPEWVDDIAERTHSHGMRLSGHIPAFMSAEQAVRAGYDEIQHINMVFLNFLAGDREDTRKQLRFTLYGDEAGKLDLDSQEVEDYIALFVEKGTTIDPTAAIFMEQLVHLAGNPNPTFAPVIDHLPTNVARGYYKADMDMRGMVDEWAASAVAQAAMIKKLHDNGVQIVPGSDNVAAFTIHRELELYAEAGISNADVLRIGSLDSARIVGVDDRTGSIKVGKDSDIVLVEGNPLEDISAIRRATLVMKGNTAYKPDELYKAVGVKPFLKSE
ncbi:MAG: amidohydrolase family protein, partial [Gammaproteobacteria bacterium]|nr:amidohydrolase family protein [Gammaproteobacteria bacterium]